MQETIQQPCGSIEEEKIDIHQFLSTIWDGKYFIMIITLIITSITIVYVLAQPNVYKSETILVPKEQSGGKSIGGGAAALAAMAGISLGGGGLDLSGLFNILLYDYAFNKRLINKYHLAELLSAKNVETAYVFPGNKREVYEFLKNPFGKVKEKPTPQQTMPSEKIYYDTFKQIKKILSIIANKEQGTLIISATHPNRFILPKLISIYLREMSEHIKYLDLKEIDEQVHYYEKELKKAKNLDLRANITALLSSLVKKKVLSQAGEFYMVKQLIKPKVPYIEEKIGPNRANMVILSFVASIILGIAIILLRDYLKRQEDEEESEHIEKLSF